MNAIVPKKCAPIIRLVKWMPNAGQWDMHGKSVSMSATSLLSFFPCFLFCLGREQPLVESSVGKEPDGSVNRVDGEETVGNSLRRAPFGKSEVEATTRSTEGKPWEIDTFNYCTGKVLHTEAFTQRSLYTE
jgi:hypothetical protein